MALQNWTKEIGRVYETFDYDKFDFLQGNRRINARCVEKIANSMRSSGWLGAPIIVSKDWGVIDGQHRLCAARKAGIGVLYTFSPEKSIEKIQEMNMSQTKWSAMDFIQAYADSGDANYQKFVELNREFVTNASKMRKLSTNVVMAASTENFRNTYDVRVALRREFTLTDTQVEESRKRLTAVADCLEAFRKIGKWKFGRTDYIGKAILFMIVNGAKTDRLRDAIRNYGMSYVPSVDIRTSLVQLEGLYNRGRREKMYFQSQYDKYVAERK